MAREYVPVAFDYLEEMEPLSDADFGRLIRALILYARDGVPVELDGDCRFYAKRVMNKDAHYARRAEEEEEKAAKRSAHAKNAITARWTQQDEYSSILENTREGNTKPIQINPNQDQTNPIQDQSKPDQEEVYTVPEGTVCRTKDVRHVMEAWNSLGLQQLTKITPGSSRGKMLRARIHSYGTEAVLEAIEKIRQSTFLKGQNSKGWVITFEWFVRPNNFPKVLEGNYDNGRAKDTVETANPFLKMLLEDEE
ncbi:MAG: hypothetical protein IKO00_02235 [Oscillospiraceae bacterium]|nr:hypothetical protein [Oscillospiraceae bacterium]